MTERDLELDFEDLSSAEDFLNYFEVPYDTRVVLVNRLHIMQRFHDYLEADPVPQDQAAPFGHYQRLLTRSYQDFLHSDAQTEKVLDIFKRQGPQETVVPLDAILKG